MWSAVRPNNRSAFPVHPMTMELVTHITGDRLFTRIHTLDEDALLNIFYILGLDFVDPYEDVISQADWDRVRWWYKPAQVCRRWRNLILASPVRLNLQLVCTYGTPVADMLSHSPPLPLVINYLERDRERTIEDENGIILALQHRDRVRRIGLVAPPTNLLRPLTAMAGRFPTLERLFIRSRTEEDTNLELPESLQAPCLRGLALSCVGLSPGSPLLTTSTGLVILVLERIPPLAYFPPSELLARLSSSTQLRTLSIGFTFPAPDNYAEGQLSHSQTMAHVTLPNLRSLFFHGTHDYLEALLSRMSTPQLEAFHVWFYYRFTFNCPHLSQFTTTIPKLRFNVAHLHFYQSDVMLIASKAQKGNRVPFRVQINCTHLDWQVASAAQVFSAFLPILSVVEHLALLYLYYKDDRGDPRELYHDNDVDPAQWRELLRPFQNVKTLSVADALVGDLSRSLRVSDREPSLGLLLPELRELRYSGGDRAGDALAPFILARQTAGQAIDLVLDSTPRRSISPSP
jgi:hypothetical protein